MPAYAKAEARAWARANLQGCVNVTIPSFSADLKRLNEKAIRHDIARAIELGFEGTLLVSEVNITADEYVQFTEWAADEAAGRLHLVFHAAFDTLEENIELANRCAAAGADYVLLCYPPCFYPASQRDVYDYTKGFCDGVDLGAMLFPVPLWNFGRLHPADIDPAILVELVRDVPNIVAIKAEGGMPTIGGLIDVHRRLHKEVVISCPLEKEVIPLMAYMEFQYSGTSYTEYFGDWFPRTFALAKAGRIDEAMDAWWQVHPARMAVQAVSNYVPSTLFLNRMAWKYQGWLQGMNGGPLRRPTMKIPERDMNILRQGLVNSKLNPTGEPNAASFVGRHPC